MSKSGRLSVEVLALGRPRFVPVEVRNLRTARVMRFGSFGSKALPPGLYSVTATFSDGYSEARQIELEAGSEKTVTFRIDNENDLSKLVNAQPSREQAAHDLLLPGVRASYRQSDEDCDDTPHLLKTRDLLGGDSPLYRLETWEHSETFKAEQQVEYRVLVGNRPNDPGGPEQPGLEEIEVGAGDILELPAHLLRLLTAAGGDSRPLTLEWRVAGSRPRYIRLPHARFFLQMARSGDGLKPQLHFCDTLTDDLFTCFHKGAMTPALLTRAAIRGQRSTLPAHKLTARTDPVRLLIAAYTLLRRANTDRTYAWVFRQLEPFTYLADVLVIEAERQAFAGDHEAAAQHLLTLTDFGLPVFADGLSYAVNRLRLYTGVEGVYSESESVEAHGLLRELQRYANASDFTEPLVTYFVP